MVEEIKDVSPAEYQIMEILWSMGEASIREVHTVLKQSRKVAYTTVATLFSRLKSKGYVDAREKNFAWLYRPIVTKDEVVERKMGCVIDMLFDGEIEPLAVYIARVRNLTPEQLEIIKKIVGSKGGGDDDERSLD
jgi:predicted transcriptional regulator